MVTASQFIENPLQHFPRATVACFDPTTGDLPRRRLDHQRTIEFLRRLAEAGAPAVLIAASTGQGHLRTVDELEEWFAVAARAPLGATTRMALLRPEDGVAANRRLIEKLRELEYPIVFFRPGTDLDPSATDAEIADSLQPLVEMAAGEGLAVGLYSIPDVSGVRLTAEAAARIVAGPGGQAVVAVKVTEADYEASTKQFLSHEKLAHLKIVQGWDPHLARALQEGGERCGVTSGPMSLAVYQYLHILDAADRGEWDEVAAAQEAVTRLFAAMQDDPTRFADLQRAKYVMGLGHPITGTVTPEQVERLLNALDNLPRAADRARLARSLDLMQDGPLHDRLRRLYEEHV